MAEAEQYIPPSELTSIYLNKINELATGLRPISPDALQQVLGTNGGLGQTLGFNASGDTFGLTPETLNASMRTYRNPIDVMSQGAQMVDAVTGRSKIAQANISAETATLSPRMQANENVANRQQREEEFDANHEIALRNLDITEEKLLNDNQVTKSTIQHQREVEKLGKARYELERKRQMKLDKYLNAATSGNTSVPMDAGLYKSFEMDEQKYMKDKNNKPVQSYDDMAKDFRVPWLQAYMKKSTLGANIGQVFETKGFKKDIGWSNLILTREGWYGVDPDREGKISVNSKRSASPVVPIGGIPIKGGGSGRAQELTNVYAGQGED